MSLAHASKPPLTIPHGVGLTLAALGPVAIGGLLATQATTATPLAAAPAIIFGVVAATSPALYIAIAVTGDAPPLSKVARAFIVAFGAFGIALAGLLLPAAFLSLTSVNTAMTFAAVTAAVGAAAFLGLRRLARELSPATGVPASLMSSAVFLIWSAATIGIAGRLWLDLADEVLS